MKPQQPVSPSHIVGIGASAGGLAALEEFFKAMPEDSGMAFVLAQHISPDFKRLMDDLLAQHTKMPIHKAENGLALEANAIYLIPPRQVMTVSDGRLYLQKQAWQQLVLPIDIFFESLARATQNKAIGIVLSGTGSDGAQGIQTIHQASGLVFVQSVESAQFDGMPRAAINTGICDYVTTPSEMPVLLLEYAKNPDAIRPAEADLNIGWDEGEYAEIFAHLRRSYGLDFSKYKPATVERRIIRRLGLRYLQKLSEYIQIIETDPQELDALYHDLLIGVTKFFRDAAAFVYLEREIIPTLFRDAATEGLRVWVAACATGEEAYSLAMLLHEHAQKIQYTEKISIFATDAHQKSLDVASQGLYEKEQLQNVSAERLTRYFVPDSTEKFKVVPELRKMVVFAPQNLISDPPFTKIDLLCCRNLLIYFSSETQERSIASFNFALRMGGVMFLGSSEGLGKFSDDFSTLHSTYKIFRKQRDVQINLNLHEKQGKPTLTPSDRPWGSKNSVVLDRQILHDYDQILKRYIPTGVLLNQHHQVLHYFGDVNQYLKPPEGRAEVNFGQMVIDPLHLAVNIALQRATTLKGLFTLSNVAIEQGRVDIAVDCIHDEKTNSTHYLVTFNPVKPAEVLSTPAETKTFLAPMETSQTLQAHITELEQDLQSAHENLQATVEELQASNEELQATNEELLASNEELQSTNEELHSLNEELYTVNAEYEKKNAELLALNNDQIHLLASLEVGVVFLDEHLIIRRFNPTSAMAFKLLPQDVGRPINHIAFQLTNQNTLLESLYKVLQTGETIESEVQATNGTWLLQRILPYLDEKRKVTGVILTFTDVTKIKNNETRLRTLFELLPVGVTIMDKDRNVVEANAALEKAISIGHDSLIKGDYGKRRYIRQDGSEMPTEEFASARISKEGKSVENIETGIVREDDTTIWVNVSGAPLPDGGMVVVTTDITENKKAEQTLQRWKDIFQNVAWGIVVGTPDGKTLEQMNPAFSAMHGYTEDELTGMPIPSVFAPESRAELPVHIQKAHEQGHHTFECNHIRKDGSIFPAAVDVVAVKDANGKMLYRIVGVQDITARKQAEEKLRESEEKYRTLLESLDSVVVVFDANDRCMYANEIAAKSLGITVDKMLGASMYDLLSKEDASKNLAAIQQVIRENNPISYDNQVEVQGQLRWYHTTILPIHDEKGNATHALLNATNIDHLKQVQQELQNLNQSLEKRVQEATTEIQDLYNNAPAGYHSLDANGNVKFINETELSLLGRSREEVIGHFFAEFIVPHQVEQFKSQHLAAIVSGQPVHDLEYDLVRPNQSTVPVMINCLPVMGQNGKYIRSRGTVIDLTERKKAENALRATLTRVNALYAIGQKAIEATEIGPLLNVVANILTETLAVDRVNILIMDVHNKSIEYASKSGPGLVDIADISFDEAWEGLTGWALREQKIAWSPAKIPDYRESLAVQKRRSDTNAGEVIVAPLIYQNQPLGTITLINKPQTRGFGPDDLNLLQAVANQVATAIERMYAGITLRQANIELGRAMRMKDEFLASMSHELRTPLTGILGLSEALQMQTYGELSEKQARALKNIETSGRHLLELINDMLDLSKIEAGKLDLRLEPCSLNEICQASLQLTRGMVQSKNLNVSFSMNPTSIVIRADARRLKQMLVNLLSNAIKFTNPGGEIGLEVQADTQEHQVAITVWDKGIGISVEDLKKLFKPFVQLDSSLSRQHTGSGLGLSLVQRMAELQGGSVKVESQPGEGSRFTIILPWSPHNTQPITRAGLKQDDLQHSLTVDDNELDAELITRYLQNLGISNTIQSAGTGAVDIAARINPNVILLDLHLPDKSGFDVLAELKTNPHTKDIPVIICSVEDSQNKALTGGAAGYLVKPFTLDDMRNELNRVAEEHKIPRSVMTIAPRHNLPLVMITDDNDVILETVSDFIATKQFRVAVAHSGMELLDFLAQTRPDIILMDIQMPGMDGLETIRRVRSNKDPLVAQIPIIAITALAMQGDRELCIQAGANEYISKPIQLQKLATTIRTILGKI